MSVPTGSLDYANINSASEAESVDAGSGITEAGTGDVDRSSGRERTQSDPVQNTSSGNTNEGLADHLTGSVDESISRQFDDEPGGGFIDEAANVADPTKSASAQTERDVQAAGLISPDPASTVLAATSFATGAGESPEGETTHRPNSPVDQAAGQAENAAEDIQQAIPEIDLEIPEGPMLPSLPSWAGGAAAGGAILLVIGALLYLLGPFAEAYAASQGG